MFGRHPFLVFSAEAGTSQNLLSDLISYVHTHDRERERERERETFLMFVNLQCFIYYIY